MAEVRRPLPGHWMRVAVIGAVLAMRQQRADITWDDNAFREEAALRHPDKVSGDFRGYEPKVSRVRRLTGGMCKYLLGLVTGCQLEGNPGWETYYTIAERSEVYSAVMYLFTHPPNHDHLPSVNPAGVPPAEYASALLQAWSTYASGDRSTLSLEELEERLKWKTGAASCQVVKTHEAVRHAENRAAACRGKAFQLTATQKFRSLYFTGDNPFKGALHFDSTGSGKTCTLMAILSARMEARVRQILWVGPIGRQYEFLKNVYDMVCSETFAEYADVIGPETFKKNLITHMGGDYGSVGERMSALRRIIPEWLQPMTFKQLENAANGLQRFVRAGQKDGWMRDLLPSARVVADFMGDHEYHRRGGRDDGVFLTDPLFRTTLVIDEGHKIFAGEMAGSSSKDPDSPEERERSELIRDMIHHSYRVSGRHSCRVHVLSASAIGRAPKYFFRLLNLFLDPTEEQLLPEEDAGVNSLYRGGKLTPEGRKRVEKALTGRVGYLDARLDLSAFAVYRNYTSVNVEMSDTQFKAVQRLLRRSLETGKPGTSEMLARMQRKAAWSKNIEAYKFDHASYPAVKERLSLQYARDIRDGKKTLPSDVTERDLLLEWSPKIAALIRNIEAIDKADVEKYGGQYGPGFKGFKHAIYVGQTSLEGGNLEGVKMVYSALMQNGFHNTFRLEKERYPVLDLGSPKQRRDRRNMVLLAKTAVHSSSSHTGSPAWKERVLGLSHLNPCDEAVQGRIGAAMSKWDRLKNSNTGSTRASVLVSRAQGAVNWRRLDNDLELDNEYDEASVRLPRDKPAWTLSRNGQFNLPENKHGELIRFVVFDRAFQEGVDMFDVRYMHLFDCPGTVSDAEQVGGRALRRCGDLNLPKTGAERQMGIFEYSVVPRKAQIRALGGPALVRKWEAVMRRGISLCDAEYSHRVDQINADRVAELKNLAMKFAVDAEVNKPIMQGLVPATERKGRVQEAFPTIKHKKTIKADFGNLGAIGDTGTAAQRTKAAQKKEAVAQRTRAAKGLKEVGRDLERLGTGVRKATDQLGQKGTLSGNVQRGGRRVLKALPTGSKGVKEGVGAWMDLVDTAVTGTARAFGGVAETAGKTAAVVMDEVGTGVAEYLKATKSGQAQAVQRAARKELWDLAGNVLP